MCNSTTYSESGAPIAPTRCADFLLLQSDRDRLAGVVAGLEEQGKRNLDALRQAEAERDYLYDGLNKILHPNGDGPARPSGCDLLSFLKGDLRKFKAQMEKADALASKVDGMFKFGSALKARFSGVVYDGSENTLPPGDELCCVEMVKRSGESRKTLAWRYNYGGQLVNSDPCWQEEGAGLSRIVVGDRWMPWPLPGGGE